MNKNQFLLLKLAEECAEVAHRASKQLQFGKDEIQRDHTETNGRRLRGELLDLAVIWKMLDDLGEIPGFSDTDADSAFFAKKEKMQKYLDKSFALGQLPEIKL